MDTLRKITKDKLKVRIFNSEILAGKAAAEFVANHLNEVIQSKGYVNMILATGASQFAFLDAIKTMDVDWSKITAFHLDEYKGLPETHPASFRKYLKERIIDIVKPGKMYYINGDAEDIDNEIERYEELLKAHPIDIACIGIGENGHIAFNDPGVADFADPRLVKIAQLDDACRRQQLGEGWFSSFDDVPKEAVSLTVSAIMNCKVISAIVPDKRKAEAVYKTLNAEISTECPATILRIHDDATLFLDENSASML